MGSNSDGDSDESDYFNSIVIDNGSGFIKAGYGSSDTPRAVFPTVVGIPCGAEAGESGSGCYVGDEVYEGKHSELTLKYPIENGIITDWDDMEKVWHHIFNNELRSNPEEHSVLHTEPPFVSKANREKQIEIMFEKFNVRGMYVSIQELLSLYASGRTTGLVVCSGYSKTHTIPISEGFMLPPAIKCLDIGGRHLTEYLKDLLGEQDYGDLVNDIKEKMCSVSKNPEDIWKHVEETGCSNEGPYELPDGNTLFINNKRYQCPEALFDPSLISLTCEGVHHAIYNCIMSCDIDIRRDLNANILLSGGNTMFEGMGNRIKREVWKLSGIPWRTDVRVIDPPERKYSAWIGGALLSNFSTFQEMWITRAEYEEHGPSIVHRKCN